MVKVFTKIIILIKLNSNVYKFISFFYKSDIQENLLVIIKRIFFETRAIITTI